MEMKLIMTEFQALKFNHFALQGTDLVYTSPFKILSWPFYALFK